jgi:hypothetical protein
MRTELTEMCIENNDVDGYCIVKKITEGQDSWLQINGNEAKPEYPLTLDSHKEIDYFCEKLHAFLEGKLVPTGFIKD